MSTNTYFIIGGIAIVFVIYMIILQVLMQKRRKSQLDNFNKTHSNIPLSQEQKRLLVFGAILFYYRMEEIVEIKPKMRLDEYKYGLENQWGITNSSEAKETLHDLLKLKKSNEFEPLLKQNSEDLMKIRKSIARKTGVELSEVERTKSAYAWDICRAVSLAKWCYWGGYLTESETWDIMSEAAKTANNYGRNWTDYTISFLLGRTIHGFDMEDVIIECEQLLKGKFKEATVYQVYSFRQ